MKDLIEDIEERLSGAALLSYVHQGGGVLTIPSLDKRKEYPVKAPMIVVIEQGTESTQYLSSHVIRRVMIVTIHVLQKIFGVGQAVKGDPAHKGLTEMENDVKKVMHVDHRFGGKYSFSKWMSTGPATPVEEDNPHHQEKAMRYMFIRYESA